ncbi:hydroxymethylbilane synthase [Tissierella pigra]|uniref:Porphobilinogen deaminase n=1 Tax=Tissierella pigra TaxID=2607614 RepID=A0A6N7XUS4_9FIRM|nr:hydroxymethylbilane synthase [Tissierella pigra]MBU5427535.1 hydroxymethylbilane synthase [Tissierella pigra]MSU00284.1 hydroxymethylbilane synthase [Tissierella pigra]
MKIIVGSRGSNLALTQTNMVIDSIKKVHPEIEFEVKVIKTKGDILKDIPIDKLGGKEIFIKEIEKELLDNTIHMAIHSMKDMPGELPKGLKLSFSPIREDYRDVLVLRQGLKSIDDIPQNGKIGTGSKRRKYQILKHREDLEVVGIRGNIETRISKIYTENLDGVILAAAGIHRLGLELGENMVYLDKDIVLPSPTQGILAIEIREDNHELEEILKSIAHEETGIQSKVERVFLKAVGGSCNVPVGAYCEVKEGKIRLEGLLGTVNGEKLVRRYIEGDIDQGEALGESLAKEILKEVNIIEG